MEWDVGVRKLVTDNLMQEYTDINLKEWRDKLEEMRGYL